MASDEQMIELEIGPVAHGGHCVARHEGRVVFVRHTLPGERVRAVLTDSGPSASYWRADTVEVLEASPDRVPSAWPAAGPGGVGGAELAHVALPAQRAWKAAVLREQLQRLARIDRDVEIQAVPGDDERGGLRWRTRIDLVADPSGRAGMRGHRSHEVARARLDAAGARGDRRARPVRSALAGGSLGRGGRARGRRPADGLARRRSRSTCAVAARTRVRTPGPRCANGSSPVVRSTSSASRPPGSGRCTAGRPRCSWRRSSPVSGTSTGRRCSTCTPEPACSPCRSPTPSARPAR